MLFATPFTPPLAIADTRRHAITRYRCCLRFAAAATLTPPDVTLIFFYAAIRAAASCRFDSLFERIFAAMLRYALYDYA